MHPMDDRYSNYGKQLGKPKGHRIQHIFNNEELLPWRVCRYRPTWSTYVSIGKINVKSNEVLIGLVMRTVVVYISVKKV